MIAGTGFIGGHVASALAAAGCETTALVRSRERAERDPRLVGVHLAVGSATEPPGEVMDGPFELVVYAAGVWRRQDRSSEAEIAERCRGVYVRGVETLARRALDWKAHFVFMSGISRYGDAFRGLVSESTRPGRLSIYGEHKRKSEAILEDLGARGLRWTALVPPEVYGSQDPGGWVRFVHDRVRARRFVLLGSGENRWSLCNVKNVADAVVHFSSREGAGPLHVADERPYSQRDLATQLAVSMGVRPWFPRVPTTAALSAAWLNERVPRPAFAPKPLSVVHVRARTENLLVDTSQAFSLGFRPRFGLEEGIREAVEWWRSNPEV